MNIYSESAFQARAKKWLTYAAHHEVESHMMTEWGPYHGFDVRGLACMALNENLEKGKQWLIDSLDMIDQNFIDERKDPGACWHLADFAMHPLLRTWKLYRESRLPGDPIWERIADTFKNFLFHREDLTENHNLLHAALRYLAGQTWPAHRFGEKTGEALRAEARSEILAWYQRWVHQGSSEWGSDIYYNVNLLALLNLVDFAEDPELQAKSKAVLDFFAFDEAQDAFSGSMAAAARRSYAVYRMDLRESPSRPLHMLWFGTAEEDQPFNLNFIGFVLMAAVSSYRVPDAVAWIAREGAPAELGSTHLTGLWPETDTDQLSKHTYRLPNAMISAMNSPGGNKGRFTEHMWQLTLGNEALVFSNHPSLETDHCHFNVAGYLPWPEAKKEMENDQPALNDLGQQGAPWFWKYANMPPGTYGDVRPGYWQGNTHGPRCLGVGRAVGLIYQIDSKNPLPFAHLFLRPDVFDECVRDGNWIFLRKGNGYGAIWTSCKLETTTTGRWAGCEEKFTQADAAVLAWVGDETTESNFESFMATARKHLPVYEDGVLKADLPEGALQLEFDEGGRIDGETVKPKGCRFSSPWGNLPLGNDALEISTPAGDCRIALNP